MEIHLVAVILDIDQFFDHIIPVLLHPRAQRDHHIKKFFRCTQTVDAGYRGNHYDIFALAECRRCREAELIDLVVSGSVLCYIGVGRWDVCFWLVVIIIGDKLFYCVLREEFLHLAVKLRCQCFIVRKYQGWFVEPGDDIRHREGLTGAGDTKQSLELVAFLEALD